MNHTKLTVVALFALACLTACASDSPSPGAATPATTPTPAMSTPTPAKPGELAYLKGFVGKAPYDVDLWKSQPLNNRLKKLLGDKYAAFTEAMQATSPVSAEGDVIFVTGNNKRTGNQAILLADLARDVINAKLLVDKTKKVEDFADPGAPVKQPADVQAILSNFTGK